MTAIAHTTRLAALTLLLCGSAFAQTIHIQVDVDARHLHADTESVRVLCRLENGKQSAQGHANLRVKKGRASDTLNVPITIDQAFSQYQSVNCGLQVCKKGASDRCQTPLPHSKGIATTEQYRAYDEGAKNRLTAHQPLNQSTPSTTGGDGSLAAETSPIVTGVNATTETGVVVEESAFQPIIFNLAPLLATGISIAPFQPRIVAVTAMTGAGTAFIPKTLTVAPLIATGVSVAPFQPRTIDATAITGTGTAFTSKTFTMASLVATGLTIAPFQSRIIAVTAMTGIGTAFTPKTFTMAPLVVTGISVAPFQPKIISVTPMTGVGAPVKNL